MARVPCPGRVWKSNVCLQKKKDYSNDACGFCIRSSDWRLACPFRQVRTCPFLAAASTRARFTIALSCVVGVSGMARVSLTRLLRASARACVVFSKPSSSSRVRFLLGHFKRSGILACAASHLKISDPIIRPETRFESLVLTFGILTVPNLQKFGHVSRYQKLFASSRHHTTLAHHTNSQTHVAILQPKVSFLG